MLMLFGLPSFAEESTAHPIRQIFEQDTHLAHQPVSVKAWLTHRQVYQQQALSLYLSTTSPIALGKLNVVLRTSELSDWLMTDIQPLAVEESNGQLVHRWQVDLFAKRDGLLMLPQLSLQLEGKSMARKTLSLPSVSIRVLPLPFYLPKETLVGASLSLVEQTNPSTQWGLVGDRLTRELVFTTESMQKNRLTLPFVQGQGVQGLSPVIQHKENQIHITQAWQIQSAGSWQIEDQHLWLFNPETLNTTHLVIAGTSGTAIPVWLWRAIQAVILLVILLFLGWMGYLARQGLQRYRYQQSVLACGDADQLVRYLKQHYGYPDTAILSHRLPKDHPHYAEIVQLEGMLFAQNQLYGEVFEVLKQKIAD